MECCITCEKANAFRQQSEANRRLYVSNISAPRVRLPNRLFD
jgi:hypothetical protein